MKNRIKPFYILPLAVLLFSCSESPEKAIEGKVKRDVIAFSPKITGRILKIYVQEGDRVNRGDTLAVLDVPEAVAKRSQVMGAVKATQAQKTLTQNGATPNQLKQLKAKKSGLQDQFSYAEKSLNRAKAMRTDSMISPQAYDEIVAKYQGAKAQLDAVTAELNEAESGIRFETKLGVQGQAEQALGTLQEVEIALSERYIIATNNMTIETISLHEGELATAGFPLFNGYLPQSVYFRFTIPERQVLNFKAGNEVALEMPFLKQKTRGKVAGIKQLNRYANITAAYPDYQIEEALYEVKVIPENLQNSQDWLTNATVLIAKK